MDKLETIEIGLRNAMAALETDLETFSAEWDLVNDALNAVCELQAEREA